VLASGADTKSEKTMSELTTLTPTSGETGPPEAKDVDSSVARPRGKRQRWLRRTLAVTVALTLVVVVGGQIFLNTATFGASPSGGRQAQIELSPEWSDGQFANPQPLWLDFWDAMQVSMFGGVDTSSPDPALNIDPTNTDVLAAPPADGLRVTWFGHSSTLVEIDGIRVLVDPFWGEYSGPNALFGLNPFFPAPAALSDIGPVDAVVISHDHWDHLDYSTISAMSDWSTTEFVVPLGIGAHLELWVSHQTASPNSTGGKAAPSAACS
jgi:Beta-lactamase superfamily domain